MLSAVVNFVTISDADSIKTYEISLHQTTELLFLNIKVPPESV
jgi:hypothetical protein